MARKATYHGTYREPTIIDPETGKEAPTGERVPNAYVDGVPARDLDEADWAGLTDTQRLAAMDTVGPDGKKLYTVTGITAEREAVTRRLEAATRAQEQAAAEPSATTAAAEPASPAAGGEA